MDSMIFSGFFNCAAAESPKFWVFKMKKRVFGPIEQL
jgi:hypothetical protein